MIKVKILQLNHTYVYKNIVTISRSADKQQVLHGVERPRQYFGVTPVVVPLSTKYHNVI